MAASDWLHFRCPQIAGRVTFLFFEKSHNVELMFFFFFCFFAHIFKLVGFVFTFTCFNYLISCILLIYFALYSCFLG